MATVLHYGKIMIYLLPCGEEIKVKKYKSKRVHQKCSELNISYDDANLLINLLRIWNQDKSKFNDSKGNQFGPYLLIKCYPGKTEKVTDFSLRRTMVLNGSLVTPKIDRLRIALLKNPGRGELECEKLFLEMKITYKRQWPLVVYKKQHEQYFFADFILIFPKRKFVCFEIDGDNHNEILQHSWDEWRSQLLNELEIPVVRLNANDVSKDQVLDRLFNAGVIRYWDES